MLQLVQISWWKIQRSSLQSSVLQSGSRCASCYFHTLEFHHNPGNLHLRSDAADETRVISHCGNLSRRVLPAHLNISRYAFLQCSIVAVWESFAFWQLIYEVTRSHVFGVLDWQTLEQTRIQCIARSSSIGVFSPLTSAANWRMINCNTCLIEKQQVQV